MTTVTSIHDNGDGTYTFVFSEPVTVAGAPSIEANMQAWNADGQTADVIIPPTNGTSATWTFGTLWGNTGLNQFVFLAQPTNLTAAHPFQLATGVTPIS